MKKNNNIKQSLYILTEGYTEQAYFSRISEILGDDDEWRYAVTVHVREIADGSKTDPVNMVREAKKSQKDYDYTWVVFDKDRERDLQNLQALELATKSKINVAFSSISFEEWVLLHFEKNISPFERSDCASRGQQCTCLGTKCASTYIKLNYYPSYKKGKAKLYDELSQKRDTALEFAAWLRYRQAPFSNYHMLNPYTDVDTLVTKLFGLPTIRYSGICEYFSLDQITFFVTNYSVENLLVSVSIKVTNNSPKSFIFNEAQNNITLMDNNNSALTYSIPETKIINAGHTGLIDIQFNTPAGFYASKLRFHSINECVFVEIP